VPTIKSPLIVDSRLKVIKGPVLEEGPIPITFQKQEAISTAAKTISESNRAAIVAQQKVNAETLASYSPARTTVSNVVLRGQDSGSTNMGAIVRPSNPTIPVVLSEIDTEQKKPGAVGAEAGNPSVDIGRSPLPMLLVAAVMVLLLVGAF